MTRCAILRICSLHLALPAETLPLHANMRSKLARHGIVAEKSQDPRNYQHELLRQNVPHPNTLGTSLAVGPCEYDPRFKYPTRSPELLDDMFHHFERRGKIRRRKIVNIVHQVDEFARQPR